MENEAFVPTETGNVSKINQVCLGVHPILMLRYEAVADFYTEEPVFITVRETEDSERRSFEQVFRIRTWVPSKNCSSWIVYLENREWRDDKEVPNEVIIRKVYWDREWDVQHKLASGAPREKVLDQWPRIILHNAF